MLFNSIDFLVFFPIVLVIYFILPQKIKYLWLLVTSYYFYMCWNAKYVLLILTSTVLTYGCGRLLELGKKKKLIVALCFVINLGILFYFKYCNFAINILVKVFGCLGIVLNISNLDIVLPVGISFYSFQALGYIIDVYRGDIAAEHNFFKYALFVSFFPQLVAGPIERSKDLLSQLSANHKFDWDNFREGLLLMLWGFFLKIVLADRIAIFVDTVYGDCYTYGGYYLVVASVLFAFQIYCDFAGYSTIAMGAALILGIRLTDNFNAPYLATNVAGFWRRWHISLTMWFKDYLYIPLGGSRKGKICKYINKMIVFMASGLWHGANFSFIIWGGMNGAYQVIGEVLQPARAKISRILNLNRNSVGHKIASCMVTFVLVDISWVFFRASGVEEALEILKSICMEHNPWILFDGSLYECGLDLKNYWLMMYGIGVLALVDILKKRGTSIRRVILQQDYWVRWIIFCSAICIILTFGIWGPGYDSANFLYFQF